MKSLEFGVPQGSILGPLLFLIYINDLPNATEFFIKLYADDTFLCYQHENIKTLENNVNLELSKVYEWLSANRLTLNINKSKFMIITKKRINASSISIHINGSPLEQCDSYKYLGVYFDKQLNWKTHIDYICQKISKSCGSLAKIRNCVELETCREIYHAIIHSYLKYGILAWGSASKSTLKPLQTIVNRAVRIMSFAPFGSIDLNPLYEILEILNVEQIYTLEIAKLMYKNVNNLMPVRIANYFECRNSSTSISTRRTRSQRIAPIFLFNTAVGTRSIQNKGDEIWKNVPMEIKSTPWLNSFKRMFKSHLLLTNFN